jgi:TatD DNase family protein
MLFLKKGFTLSFTGVITFASSYDEAIRIAPLESIMSETDCPYVAPAPFRGKTNEPAYVTYVVEALAKAKGIDVEACRLAMLRNAERQYGIDLGASNMQNTVI